MERAVMISIRPEWVKKILAGQKTIEVRKTCPNLKGPFKCYIYCTLGGIKKMPRDYLEEKFVRGTVVGEFVCDIVMPISVECSDPAALGAGIEVPGTCLTDRQILEYLGNGKQGFGWHISDLRIYDMPKSISSFTCIREGIDGMGWWPMYRAPQSWGYVITEGDDADESRRNA